MPKLTINDLLNRVLVMHERSLPMYLAYAAPFVGQGDQAAAEVLDQIVLDHRYLVEKIGDYLVEKNHPLGHGHWEMTFTSLHDVALQFLLTEMIRRQRAAIADLTRYDKLLEKFPAPRALVQEALGMARGHLESLEEVAHGAASLGAATLQS